ncbi:MULTISPECIES: hypothetical protein [unclassified Variovorax]
MSVSVKAPSGKVSHPQKVDVTPLLNGGLTEVQALEWVDHLVGVALETTD